MLFKHFGSHVPTITGCLSVLILSVPDRGYSYTLQLPRCLLVNLNFSALVDDSEVRPGVSDQEPLASAYLKYLIFVKAHSNVRSEVWFQDILH